jgi:hypothetical protein
VMRTNTHSDATGSIALPLAVPAGPDAAVLHPAARQSGCRQVVVYLEHRLGEGDPAVEQQPEQASPGAEWSTARLPLTRPPGAAPCREQRRVARLDRQVLQYRFDQLQAAHLHEARESLDRRLGRRQRVVEAVLKRTTKGRERHAEQRHGRGRLPGRAEVLGSPTKTRRLDAKAPRRRTAVGGRARGGRRAIGRVA